MVITAMQNNRERFQLNRKIEIYALLFLHYSFFAEFCSPNFFLLSFRSFGKIKIYGDAENSSLMVEAFRKTDKNKIFSRHHEIFSSTDAVMAFVEIIERNSLSDNDENRHQRGWNCERREIWETWRFFLSSSMEHSEKNISKTYFKGAMI